MVSPFTRAVWSVLRFLRALGGLASAAVEFDRAADEFAEALRQVPRPVERCARCKRTLDLLPDGPDAPYCAVCWDWWERQQYGGEPLN